MSWTSEGVWDGAVREFYEKTHDHRNPWHLLSDQDRWIWAQRYRASLKPVFVDEASREYTLRMNPDLSARRVYSDEIEHDPVSHPSHYTSGPKCDHCGETIECINITRNLPFNPGNSIKYLWRRYFGGKAGENQIEPVRKARFYLDDEVGRLEAMAKDGEQ